MSTEFKVGDRVRPKFTEPPIGEVIRVFASGNFLIRWSSGLQAIVTRPDELEKVLDKEE